MDLVQHILSIAFALLLLLIFKLTFNRNILFVFIAAFVAVLVLLTKFTPQFFENFITTLGGNDGNVYHRYAISMLDGFYNGNIREILRGGQDIFYFMPGMAYFIFLSYFIFGQNSLFLIVLFSIHIVGLYKLLNVYIKDYIAIILVFIISLSSKYLYLLYDLYLLYGYQPEILSITFFVFALYLTSKYVNNNLGSSYLYLISFLYVLSIFLRPNMIIPIGLIYLFIIFTLRNKETFIKLSIGFLPLSLITLHNYIYGSKFVLLTSSAFIPANYHVHFDWYIKMFYDELILDKVLAQIAKWSHDYNIMLLIIFFALIFAIFTFKRYSNNIKILILASVGSQLPLFFWHASGRYSYLAWILSLVLLISVISFYIQRYKVRNSSIKKNTINQYKKHRKNS